MKSLKPALLSASVIIMSLAASLIFADWQEPAVAPPSGNVSAPVNVSGTGQAKAGALTVQGNLTAPIFYDFNDSNYYINPAGQTSLSGPVGVGTAYPDADLDVRSGDGRGIYLKSIFSGLDGDAGIAMLDTSPRVTGAILGGSTKSLRFFTESIASSSERMRITSEGKVGIGTTAPNNIIQVYDLIDFNNTDLNTKIGYQAGKNIAGGATQNTFLGYQAGCSSLAGGTDDADRNTAIGSYSFSSNTSGFSNTALGAATLYANTTGYYNIAIGHDSLYSNRIGYENIAVGYQSLGRNDGGYQNTAIGSGSLFFNTNGNYNTASGYHSMRENTMGNYNAAYGIYSLYSNGQGLYNTAIGPYSLYSNITGSSNVSIGYKAGYYETGSNAFYVDNRDRENTAGDKEKALLYGTFAVAAADQTLKINAGLTVSTLAGTGSRTVVADATGLLSASVSDANLKTNIIPIGEDKAMAMLKDPDILGISYNWKDQKRGVDTELGFTAQMFESYKMPGLTFEDNGIKGLNYDKLTVVLWEQNKAQEEEINNLISRIEALETKLEHLK